MIKVAILDDHLVVVEGIKFLLKNEEDIEITQTFTTINSLEKNLNSDIDILLLDINLPDGNGIIACKNILRNNNKLKIIALSNFDEGSYIKRIINNGAKGYLLKNIDRTELINAIKKVNNDEVYLSSTIQKILINDSLGDRFNNRDNPKLTTREKEVLTLISKELTTEEIAQKLFISTKTVESHRSNLFQKLDVKNSAGLIRVAFEKNLI